MQRPETTSAREKVLIFGGKQLTMTMCALPSRKLT